MVQPEFDNDEHERKLAERYRRLGAIDAFDKFVDLALDGVITMDEAIKGYVEEYGADLEPTPSQ